jgi:chromosome segregation ATPase
MENETLRKQAPDQGHGRTETLVHGGEATGSGPDADLETISERWRQEKRQLKAQIERLERAVEEKSEEPSKSWANERAALETEVSRLQHAVGELIERSNNPIRATMSVREDLQVKLNAAIHAKERAVSESLHAKTAWETEKARMNAEVEQLRLMVQGKFPRSKFVADSRSKESKESKEKELEGRIAALQKELDQERAAVKVQIQKLERQVVTESRQVKELEGRIASLQKELDLERAPAKHQIQRPENQVAEPRQVKELEGRIASLQKELDQERASAKHQIQRPEHQVSEPRQVSESRGGVETEMNRVQEQIAEITKKINDPATELSTVIRKNVELETLNAYLRGMQFSLGNGKGR